MRRSNWKTVVVFIIAVMIGLAAGVAVAVFWPEKYAICRGLFVFGTIALVSGVIILVLVKLFHIGEE